MYWTLLYYYYLFGDRYITSDDNIVARRQLITMFSIQLD